MVYGDIKYEADFCTAHSFGKLRPSIFMPREFSRLTLIVECVKVERLQDISEADAITEGVGLCAAHEAQGATARELFKHLWNSINGADSWEANLWVLAISFSVVKANIDAPELTNHLTCEEPIL